MAKQMYRGELFKTPECRLSFAQGLWTARKVNETDSDDRKKFGCTLIFKLSDKRVLEEEVRKAIIGEWGEKGMERAKQGLIKLPFLAGDGPSARNKETGELKLGMGSDVFFIRPASGLERPPQVRWRGDIPASKEDVYSGCYGKAVLNAYAWNNPKSGDGVSFGLAMFQKLKEGERMGGGPIETEKWMEEVPDEGPALETEGGRGAQGLFG
jgi:hypothetical protein